MPNAKEKALLAIGTTTGLSVAAWRALFPWIGHDLQLAKKTGAVATATAADFAANIFLIDKFEDTVKRLPKKTFIIFEGRCYSFEYVNEQACRVANVVSNLGLKKGDAIGIFVHNSPEYIWIFLGLLKLGIIVAMLNINMKDEPLLNCIKITETKAIIVGQGEDLFQTIHSIRSKIDTPVYIMGTIQPELLNEYGSWDRHMLTSSPAEVSSAVRKDHDIFTPSLYVFTSGTTGLPKAAIILNGKTISYSKFLYLFKATPDKDVVYDVLPFYHVTGSAGWMSAAETGCTVVIRKKFSATAFFNDCRRYNVTIIQYIGELCRYLLALPEDPKDGVHNIRGMIGNGLRRDIWVPFKRRFKIPETAEFYGSSEGTTSLMNVADRPGAIGRLSPFLNKLDPIPKYLVKYDFSTANPIRDKNGRCIQVQMGEPGLLIGAVPPLFKDGVYKGGREINEKKLVRNAFSEGDVYFNFGDLLYLDKEYFVYFHDRIGDTFRWKGENVSTTEVSNILSSLPFVIDANVYGVEIPGHDGKAGMASVTLAKDQQPTPDILKKIYLSCKNKLPTYARPLVLRFETETRITSTFKQSKIDLIKEGFDPNIVTDPMFYVSHNSITYLPLDRNSYHNFLQSKI